jgi:branched-chain amino acid aminotransferase
MISVDWESKGGWGSPSLIPFGDLQLHPFSSSLHYGIQCFEGMKAYRNDKGEVRLFRPWCNALRLKRSSQRLTLPDFDGQELVNLISEMVKVEERWIPPTSEFSLYIRPLHFATDNALGVHSPNKSKLLVMSGPVGPYYPTGFKPISLYCATETIRSARKGTGAFKIGG